MDKLRHLNDGIQLLVAQEGDNLPIPDEAPRLMRNYQDAPAVLSTSLWISNYGPRNITSGVLTWSLGGLAHNGTMVNVCNGSMPIFVDLRRRECSGVIRTFAIRKICRYLVGGICCSVIDIG